MSKYSLITLILLFCSCVSSNIVSNSEKKKIENEFMIQNLEEVILLSESYLKNNPDDKLIYNYYGRSLYSIGRIDEAIPYLKRSIELDNDSTWISSWSYLYIAKYYSNVNINKSVELYQKIIKMNNAKNAVLFAKTNLFHVKDFRSEFISVSTRHINFYFEEYDKIDDVDSYIKKREKVFLQICNELGVNPDFTIDFYVWDDAERVNDKYNVELGFSISSKGIIHSYKNQTLGHEITHNIVYKLHSESGISTGLINEGIAVYYDFNENYPIYDRIKNLTDEDRKIVNIKDMWFNWVNYPQRISYPVAGGFIKHLINEKGIEKVLLLLKNQSYENSIEIFGDEIDDLIDQYEEWLNNI